MPPISYWYTRDRLLRPQCCPSCFAIETLLGIPLNLIARTGVFFFRISAILMAETASPMRWEGGCGSLVVKSPQRGKTMYKNSKSAITQTARPSPPFSRDEERWEAVVRRDRAADGTFYYSVRTTGVYCRPSCAARLARREHVRFHATCEEAEQAGFRPCKRCQPTKPALAAQHAAAVAKAFHLIR